MEEMLRFKIFLREKLAIFLSQILLQNDSLFSSLEENIVSFSLQVVAECEQILCVVKILGISLDCLLGQVFSFLLELCNQLNCTHKGFLVLLGVEED